MNDFDRTYNKLLEAPAQATQADEHSFDIITDALVKAVDTFKPALNLHST